MTYRRKDVHYRRARAAGYRSRSAYKLAELDARFHIFRPGDLVIDLGAWPGGWLQVARERVGHQGVVVGVDIVPVDPLPSSNVELLTGDVRDPSMTGALVARLGRCADVVLSDLAPKLSGVRDTDQARATELFEAASVALRSLLRPGGIFVTKLFMGPGYEMAIGHLRSLFSQVRATRPEATRHGSAELYVVASDFRSDGRE
jgi:23S rRNA (uridine2552-2'-O)-methyltransferase